MADKIIMVDTSILIDYYRKTDKENSIWVRLIREGNKFVISCVTKYEIYSGATANQIQFWDEVLQAIEILPLTETTIDTAVEINSTLKRKRKQIDIADLFIAATALSYKFPIATLNKKHFDRVDNLEILI